MNPATLILLVPFALILAFAVGVGIKSVRIHQASRSALDQVEGNEDRVIEHRRGLSLLSRPRGKQRPSSIAGLAKNLIRHGDGSYTKVYHVQLLPSIFDHEERIEQRVDELARLLSGRKPTNTVIQFRLSVSPDRGTAIQKHLSSKDEANTLTSADLLHMMGVDFYAQAASGGAFRQHTLSVWVRVPV